MKTKERIIYHIEYAKNWDIAASWWEICMLENIKYLVSKWEKNILLTTEKWKQAFINWWLEESELLEYNTIKTDDPNSLIKLLFNYFKRVFLAKKQIKKLEINDNDIIFCHSDFFPNSIPLYFLNKNNKKSQFFYFFHVKSPNLFKWFKGEFINKINIPTISTIYHKLNQFLYIKIIKKINKWIIIWVNPFYKKYLSKIFYKTNINLYFLQIFWGVNINKNYINNNEKKYDCVWMWRFQELKGLKELFDISVKLKNKKDDIKILVIWGGSKEVEEDFIRKIKENNLENNIIYKWFISWEERFKLISQAKIFLMTSYFESYWLVNIEAMKYWLPVIAYNLPVFEIFKKWMIKISILDNNIFSKEILKMLEDKNYYEKKSKEALEFASNYSWEKTGEEIYNLMK